jgi:hypothetical protein
MLVAAGGFLGFHSPIMGWLPNLVALRRFSTLWRRISATPVLFGPEKPCHLKPEICNTISEVEMVCEKKTLERGVKDVESRDSPPLSACRG